ncbi:hypothetical protein PHMEG_00015145 [Phytophthora megakarya]|uniref:Uncharacterized protein n=1 Tax=Phytophthora megakarya TaxID=4795 RepID=A0A225W454_9STRA|nr:hypothetical protein PHMEG_00015145 [Phytophthora megakarya]
MDTIKKGMEIENIDRWLIRYYVKIDQNKLVSGAWMVFRFDGIGSWKLYAAGTVSESSQLGLKDNAQNILQRGIEAITKITEPKRVMLRVECWDAVSLRKTGAGRPKLKALFDRFFGIQWGKPKLKELHACKQLASANITSTHNFRNHSGTVLPSKPPWSAIARTQLDVSIAPLDPSTDNRKAESVLNRLFAYQSFYR